MSDRPMALVAALDVLCRVHTREDDEIGFAIRVGASPFDFGISSGQYVAAWHSVRAAIGRPTEPA